VSTFVSVGNATQPFPRLLDAVAALIPTLPQPVFVQHGVLQRFACPGCESADFISMEEFARRVAGAQLLIMHAGAGSVLHAVRAGKVPVVVPRREVLGEHVDDHQVEFARELGRLGRIVVCTDVRRLAGAIATALRMQAAGPQATPEPLLLGQLRELLQQHVADFRER